MEKINPSITLVTAYFDIKRGQWNKFVRPNEKYISFFSFWAGIKNDLVVFTDSFHADVISKIRNEKAPLAKTIVIVIDNIYEIQSEKLIKTEAILKGNSFKTLRVKIDSPEANFPKYNYITHLKPFFLKKAMDEGYVKDFVAWIDFGFNHGGEVIVDSKDFDFLWNYPFSRKIHLFSLREMINIPLIEVTRNDLVFIQGGLIIVPKELVNTFWDLIDSIYSAMILVGITDDDQTPFFGAINEKPDLFQIHQTYWCKGIVDLGGNHMKIRNINGVSFIKKIIIKFKALLLKNFRIIKYLVRSYKYLMSIK